MQKIKEHNNQSPEIAVEDEKVALEDGVLVYCFYAKCNISMNRTAALSDGISKTLVRDIVHGWANFLSDALAKLFQVPTRSQMLAAYPVSHIRKLGHANTFMLLDATEIFAECRGGFNENHQECNFVFGVQAQLYN